jgi:NHL repeat
MTGIFRERFSRFAMVAGILGSLVAAGCSEQEEKASLESGGFGFVEKVSGDGQVGQARGELGEPVVVRVLDGERNPLIGVPLDFVIAAGGGTVSSSSVLTDAGGVASATWTLGAPPVWNRLKARSGSNEVEFSAWAEPGETPTLDLVFQGEAGLASEDLAFEQGRGLFLGSLGAILHVGAPGAGAAEIPLTGEKVQSPAGIAFGSSGDLYVCENAGPAQSLKRIRPTGLCDILSEGFGGEPFALPNSIAVHSSGQIYVSDTCSNRIFRISPADGETTEFLSIPGPNGIAFDAQETYLYILTENPSVFCFPGPSIRGGLFRVSLGPDGQPGEIETLVEGFALAGDGLAFDMEGNLYVVFSGALRGGWDRFDDSGVFVYTPDGRFNPFFSVDVLKGDIFTNIAFGVEPFDPYSLYCYGFTGRLYRVEVGIRGRTLP